MRGPARPRAAWSPAPLRLQLAANEVREKLQSQKSVVLKQSLLEDFKNAKAWDCGKGWFEGCRSGLGVGHRHPAVGVEFGARVGMPSTTTGCGRSQR